MNNELHEAILQKALELQADLVAQSLEERSDIQSTFEVGDYVLVAYPDTLYTGKGKPSTKLMPIRKGPMKVLEINKDAYTVLDIVSRRTNLVQISRFYAFFYDDTRMTQKRKLHCVTQSNMWWNPFLTIRRFRKNNGNIVSAGRVTMKMKTHGILGIL